MLSGTDARFVGQFLPIEAYGAALPVAPTKGIVQYVPSVSPALEEVLARSKLRIESKVAKLTRRAEKVD